MTRYLTLSEALYINALVTRDKKLLRGDKDIRDMGLLESALQRPSASAFGADAFVTLAEKSAALLHAIARNHPFADGNKRTATVGAVFMLCVNGQAVTWEPPQALEMILNVAEGRCDLYQLASWFPLAPCPLRLEPDETHDAHTIQQIMTEQKWLLDALESR
ncbi:MAG: type II toxin-antitoxin system death-on-curing family toxin [Phototrophicaceae bacterium]